MDVLLCNQEYWTWNGVDLGILQDSASRRRAVLHASPAVSGEGGGTSAGTAFVGRKGFGNLRKFCSFPDFDVSPSNAPGRITAGYLYVPGLPTHTLIVASAYYVVGETPFSVRNSAITDRLAWIVSRSSQPWVIAADFNANEHEVVGIACALGCMVVSPTSPSMSSGSTVDHFIVSVDL